MRNLLRQTIRRAIPTPVGDGDETVAAEPETARPQLFEVAGYRDAVDSERASKRKEDGTPLCVPDECCSVVAGARN